MEEVEKMRNMRIMFAADIHGSVEAGERVMEAFRQEEAELLILCGDIYYHGPRNSLPEEYHPMQLASILNANKDVIRCVRGNCDSEVDEMISEFSFERDFYFDYEDIRVFVTHGHKFNKVSLPMEAFDIMIFGHFHIGDIEMRDGRYFACTGSVSMPKGGTQPSYIILSPRYLTLKDLNGEVLERRSLKSLKKL